MITLFVVSPHLVEVRLDDVLDVVQRVVLTPVQVAPNALGDGGRHVVGLVRRQGRLSISGS
jgi:hypothetical protein